MQRVTVVQLHIFLYTIFQALPHAALACVCVLSVCVCTHATCSEIFSKSVTTIAYYCTWVRRQVMVVRGVDLIKVLYLVRILYCNQCLSVQLHRRGFCTLVLDIYFYVHCHFQSHQHSQLADKIIALTTLTSCDSNNHQLYP